MVKHCRSSYNSWIVSVLVIIIIIFINFFLLLIFFFVQRRLKSQFILPLSFDTPFFFFLTPSIDLPPPPATTTGSMEPKKLSKQKVLDEFDLLLTSNEFGLNKKAEEFVFIETRDSSLSSSSTNASSANVFGSASTTATASTASTTATSTTSTNTLPLPSQQQQQQQQQHHYQQQQQHHHQQQQQQLMSPPSFKRQSVLRTAKDNETLNSYLSGAHKKDPSFDPNWTHPKKPDPLPSYTSQQQQKNNRRLSRNRSSTISTADQYFTSFKEESHEDLPALPLIPDEGNLPEKSPFTKRHSKSTSSLGAGEFNFAQNELPVPEKDNVPGSLDKELPEKDLPEKDLLEKDLPKKPMELTRTETNDSMDSNSGPKRSSTSATAKKKPMLRSSSSHSNLRSKSFTKQKTSAFQEGLNIVTPSEALKTASISGWMSKRGSVSVGTWKARFFTLHGTRLSYFTSFSDTKEKGLIDVTSYRVMAVGDTDDKFVGLYAASVGAGRFCFKVVPPGPSALKGVVFTMPKVHYFAVDTREEMRAWMTAIMKATIDRDDRQPVVSSCATPTVPLAKAQELQAVARAKEEEIRIKAMANSTGEGNGNGGLFGDQINSTWLNGFGEYDDGPVAPYAVSPASSRGSSTQFTSVPSATTNNTNDDNDIRHVTTKTAGLRVVTDLENV